MNTTAPPARRLTGLYVLLGLGQAAHSMEEMSAHLYDFFWTATGLLHSYVPSVPQFRMAADTFAVLNMGFIVFFLATVPFVYAGRPWALFLAGVAGVIETLNGIGHLSGTIVFGGYVPGAVSAPFLLLLGILTLRELRRSEAWRS